jgi:hypothetical protein
VSKVVHDYGEAAMTSYDQENRVCRDYSEEAIPERDPSYRLADGTGHEQATIEAISTEVRRDLARRLQELGMSWARAAFVAGL